MAQNLGTIWYEVDADTAKLIEASRRADAELGRLGSAFDKSIKRAQGLDPAFKQAGVATDELGRSFVELGRRAGGAIDPLKALQGLALGYVSFNAAKGLADVADNYRAMSERVSMATNSMEEFNYTQNRLLESANRGKRPIEEAQELFIATSDNLRGLGYSLEQSIDITDSLSYAFVRNATATDKARTAIDTYDRVLSKGKMNAQEWQSISSGIGTLTKNIGDAFGKTAQEIDNLGHKGELSVKWLNEGLLKSLEDNKKAADSMADTVQDAFTKLSNNFKRFVGEANQAHGATDVVTKGLDLLAENLQEVSNVLLGVGAVALARYVGGLSKKITANATASIASKAQAKEELQLAIAHEREARAAMLAAQRNVALGGSHEKATAAVVAHTVAAARLQQAQTATISAASRLMGFLGGPAGLAFIAIGAATAFADFEEKTHESRKTLDELGVTLDEIIKKFEEMGRAQQKAVLLGYISEEKVAAEDLKQAYIDLRNEMLKFVPTNKNLVGGSKGYVWDEFQLLLSLFREAEEKGEDVLDVIEKLGAKWGIPQEAINSMIKNNKVLSDLIASYKEAQDVVSETSAIDKAAQSLEGLNLVMGSLPQAIRATTEALKEQKDEMAGIEGEAGRYLNSLLESNAALKDKGSEVGRVTRMIARLREEGKEVGTELEKQLIREAKWKDSQKGLTTSTNKNAEVISNLRREISLTALSAREYAIAKAEASLTDVATQDEINKVRELAAALYEAQQIASRKAKFGETGIDADNYILGDTSPLSGGMFDDQYARYEAEAVAEQERYAAQLERLKEAKELQIETSKDYYALEEEAAQTHADRMAQIEQAKNQVILSSYSSAFGSMAEILKTAQGEQSSAYQVMFAASQAFALAEAGLNIGKAISQALADPSAMTTEQKLANYGLIMSEGTKILSGISNIAYGGGRQYGGPVAANKMYRINETGEPEIFNAGGRQYFLPNQKGEVVPAGKGGAGNMNFNPSVTINVEASSDMDQEQLARSLSDMVDGKLKRFAYDSQRPGGAFYRR